MDRKFLIFALVLIALGAAFGGLFGRLSTSSASNDITKAAIISDYREALEVIDKNYGGPVDHEKISDTSIQSTLWSLDPHSAFFTREAFRKLNEEQASQFFGIGVSILQRRDGVYVQSVVPNTPADKAGLRYGDRFLQVDGKDATEWSSGEVSRNVRGPRGSTVRIRIDRAASETPIDFEIVRGGVPLPSIRNFFMLPEGVGYIGLVGGFQETTSAELDDAVASLKRQGMKSLILDVRNNPGGLLPQAVEVVSRFIATGQTVVSVKGRSRYAVTEEMKASGGAKYDLPLVVMINNGSASASEIVAGAIQDHARGLVVGMESFGKGLVQRVFPLPYGTGLTLTTARYYTPYGRSLQRDYSNGSIYEYYSHSNNGNDQGVELQPIGDPVITANGRVFYGGRGIVPDIAVKPSDNGTVRFRINEAAFFFVRQLVAGKISGLESYRVEKQDFRQSIAPGSVQINDRIFEAFRAFTMNDPLSGLNSENLVGAADHARLRLREELATAMHSNEAGIQVLLESDPQILKALQSMPEAAKLAPSSIAMKH